MSSATILRDGHGLRFCLFDLGVGKVRLCCIWDAPRKRCKPIDRALSLEPNNAELWTARADVLHVCVAREEMDCYDGPCR